MQKITPFLWFDTQGEEAMKFYTSIFKDSEIISVNKLPDGQMMTGEFKIHGQRFMVLNAGPQFKFNEAISLFVNCADQAEVDELWEKLTDDGGQESRCGWLKDKFGLSWQIIPKALGELMGDPDIEKSQRVMQAMMKMGKIVVADLQAAYDGK